MRAKIAPVKNISRLGDALDAVIDRSDGTEGMVLVYGSTGVGKSTALAYYLNQSNAIYVEASPAWSLGSMLNAICLAMGQMPKGRAADIEKQITDEMMQQGRPLFIDELDHILLPGQGTSLRMLEALRSIYDKSRMPVVMSGMDKIDRKIKLREQLSRRVFQWVEFTDLDAADVRITADTLLDCHLADDLIADLITATAGRMGRLIPALAAIDRRAKGNDWAEVDKTLWGGKPWPIGR
jgi:DNA transposition AAA+ family ATPase